ncbi:MAG: type II toxin-antitoxin system HicA family toxin [Verrucomicrobia bacterium]|nr:type II toxin-antitoxin system HicA family toxin [Verrucomicrobiota bacterium]
MPKLRRLSGPEVVSIRRQFGFAVVGQHGSHVKLRRLSATGQQQTLTVPNHRELDAGTCRAVFRQASRFVSPNELWPRFYTD